MKVRARAAIAALALALAAASGPRPAAQEAPQPPPEAEKIGDDLYRIGRLTVDLKSKAAACAGKINMRRGPVEYLAVAPGGKLHESVLALDVRPLHLQVGLILLGLEPKGGIFRQGDTRVPQGSPVEIHVSWQSGSRTVRVRGEELVWDIPKKRPMEPRPWVFSGSLVRDGIFLADEERSLVAVYRDPAAIINNVLPTGADDTVYKVNERIVPAYGTPVTFTVTPAAEPGLRGAP